MLGTHFFEVLSLFSTLPVPSNNHLVPARLPKVNEATYWKTSGPRNLSEKQTNYLTKKTLETSKQTLPDHSLEELKRNKPSTSSQSVEISGKPPDVNGGRSSARSDCKKKTYSIIGLRWCTISFFFLGWLYAFAYFVRGAVFFFQSSMSKGKRRSRASLWNTMNSSKTSSQVWTPRICQRAGKSQINLLTGPVAKPKKIPQPNISNL